MKPTLSSILTWWDATMAALAGQHPFLALFINAAKAIGDKYIPTITAEIPNLPTPKAAFDWLMGLLMTAFPAESFYLSIIKGLVDTWLAPAGTLPPLLK